MTSHKLRVLLLTDADVFAGTERHILDLAQALSSLDCDVSVGCPNRGILAARARGSGLHVFPVEKRDRADVLAVIRLWSALWRREFDIIHTHNGRTAFLAALATCLSPRGYLVATQHFLQPAHTQGKGWRAGLSGALHRWIACRSARIVAISGAVRDSILSRHTTSAEKVVAVLNGISDPMAQDLTPRQSVRATLGLSADTPLIVVSARLEKEKGLDVLIRAMPQVVARLPQARCIIVGEGAERLTLMGLIKKEGMESAVTLLGFRPDVLSLVAAADAFALPSPAEPFGLALLEAIALGIPTVASRSGGPLEILDEGKAGLLVPPGDPVQLARALLRILQEPELAAELSNRGRQRFIEHFTAQRMASSMQQVYASTVGPWG